MIETKKEAPAPMPPGEYLRRRREAAGESLDGPFLLGIILRGVDLPAIENGEKALTVRDLAEIRDAFDFDINVLLALSLDIPAQVCRSCACSEFDPCDPPCGWAEQDLCTACDEPTPVQCAAAHGAAIAAGVVAFAMVPGQWLLATAAQGFAA